MTNQLIDMRTILFILLSILFTLDSSAQNRNDFGIWGGTAFTIPIVKKLELTLDGQARLEGNARYISSVLLNSSLGYKFHDVFKMTIGHRYSLRFTGNRHRVYADLNFGYEVKAIRTTFKIRLRNQYHIYEDASQNPDFTLRPRFYIGYNPKGKTWKKFNFYVLSEIFYVFEDGDNEIKKYRISGGFSYRLKKEITFNLRYIYQDGINVRRPVREHIVAIGFDVDLPRLGKRKKKGKKDKDDDDDGSNKRDPRD